MIPQPLVTVLIPCYNAEEYVSEAIDSIISQTYHNLEILCINDGSTDRTGEILDSYAEIDSRILVIHNEKNIKLIKTLNKGVQIANGKYLARMDADDVSTSNRIEVQMDFLLDHPNVDLLSSSWISIHEDGTGIIKNELRCLTPTSIRFAANFFTPIGHGFVVGKTEIFKQYPYSTDDYALHCEDYELWTRMIRGGVHIENINQVLYKIRINPYSVSRTYEDLQMKNFAECAKIHFESSYNKPINSDYYNIMVNRFNEATMPQVSKAFKQIKEIYHDFLTKNDVSKNDLSELKTVIKFQKTDILFRYIRLSSGFNKIVGIARLGFLVLGGAFNSRYKRYLKYKFQ